MKSMINFNRVIIITLLIIGCNKKEKDYPINSISLKDKDYYENLALTKGDTSAYSNMCDYYMDYPIKDILYPSLIMANKYDYQLAYLNVYEALTSQDHKKDISELENLDTKTREMALDYLKKGAAKGSKECKKILGNHYLEGKYIKKDTLKGLKLIKESEN